MFLVLLDVLAMNVAMPSLGRGFDVPPSAWSHVVDAYTLPLALGLLPAGWLVDRHGPRRTLLASLTIFAGASCAGAVAGSWSVVLTARVAQGLSAAVMLPAGLVALSLAWTGASERSRALGIWSTVSAVATALGPGVGGILVQVFGWRCVFWINVPITVLAIAGAYRLVEDRRSPRQSGPVTNRRGLIASVLAAAVMTSGANGTLQVLTMYLQGGERRGAGAAGAILLAATLPFAVLGPVSGRLVARLGRRTVAASGFVVGASGALTLGHLPGTAGIFPTLLAIGVGLGLMTAAIVGESLASWPTRPGVASGLNNALRQVGTSVGVLLGGVIAGHGTWATALTRTGAAAGLWWLVGALIVLTGFLARHDTASRQRAVGPATPARATK